MNKYFVIIFISLSGILSCSDKQDEEPHQNDPVIGLWRLVALEQNGQTVDVSNQVCIQDSHMNVSAATMTLTLSAPQQQGSSDCQTESSSVGWVNEDGTYYTVEDGERKPAIFLLNPEDKLHVEITLEGNPITLIFEK